MNTPNDGGPAFPVGFREFDQMVHGKAPYVGMPGMSLRDWFASMALQALDVQAHIANPAAKHLAKSAYEIADEMLKTRQQNQ